MVQVFAELFFDLLAVEGEVEAEVPSVDSAVSVVDLVRPEGCVGGHLGFDGSILVQVDSIHLKNDQVIFNSIQYMKLFQPIYPHFYPIHQNIQKKLTPPLSRRICHQTYFSPHFLYNPFYSYSIPSSFLPLLLLLLPLLPLEKCLRILPVRIFLLQYRLFPLVHRIHHLFLLLCLL